MSCANIAVLPLHSKVGASPPRKDHPFRQARCSSTARVVELQQETELQLLCGSWQQQTSRGFRGASRPKEEKPPEPQYGTINELHDTPRTREAVKRSGLSWVECQRRDYKSRTLPRRHCSLPEVRRENLKLTVSTSFLGLKFDIAK